MKVFVQLLNSFFQSFIERKKQLIPVSLFVTCLMCIVYYTPPQAHSYANGAPVGKTGSPGDNGITCSGCHSGNNSPSQFDSFTIASVGAQIEFQSGEVYSFEVSAQSAASTVFGFELTVEDENGNSIGDLIVTDPTSTQLIGSGNYITHTSSGVSGTNGKIWNFDWQAPEDFEGVVTLYAAGNIANGNQGGSGDVILTDSYSIQISNEVIVEGCTDPLMYNFDDSATHDDGSCMSYIFGCMDQSALNYSVDANTDDESCVYIETESCDMVIEDFNYTEIKINLNPGWHTIAYYLPHESPVVDQFEAQYGSEQAVQNNINIVKNNEGLFYWPDFMFDGIGMLEPGQGYQVRVKEESIGKTNFVFDYSINQSSNTTNYESIEINLHTGWNTVGYYLAHQTSVKDQLIDQFGSEASVIENIHIVKNNEGLFYWPEFSHEGFKYFEPGLGYQVRVKDASQGKSDFIFNPSLTVEDVSGCLDENAANYNSEVTISSGNCLYYGCMDSSYAEYFNQGFNASIHLSNTCITPVEFGCTDDNASNYSVSANVNDGSCNYEIGQAFSFDYVITESNMSVLFHSNIELSGDVNNSGLIPNGSVLGAFYFGDNSELQCAGSVDWKNGTSNAVAVFGDDSSTPQIEGFQNGESLVWRLVTPDGLVYAVSPISNATFTSYASNHFFAVTGMYLTFAHQSPIVGCMMEGYTNYNSNATVEGDCNMEGCTNPSACNFDSEVNIENSSCLFVGINYQLGGSNEEDMSGCTNEEAFNYSSTATLDNGSCLFDEEYVNNLLSQIGTSEGGCESYNVPLNLPAGWSMYGYTCPDPIDVTDAFTEIVDKVVIVKDYQGSAYLPEWGFNGIGDMNYSVGYQIKLTEQVNGFQFCPMIVGGE